MILTRNMFVYFSCYFNIDQGHSDRFKWCIVQMEASPGKPGSNVKTRSEMGYRFWGSHLKRGMRNHIFWSEIGSGFGNRVAHPHPKFWGVPPPWGMAAMTYHANYLILSILAPHSFLHL